MSILFELAGAFLLLGFVEAVIKPVAKRFVQRRILRAAPLVFEQLDPYMPALLQQCSGAEIEQIVRTKLENLTGESWAGDDLTLFFRLYDPRIAADRTLPLPPPVHPAAVALVPPPAPPPVADWGEAA